MNMPVNSLGKFPEENPNPVMRLSQQGKLLYCNKASQALLYCWGHLASEYIEGLNLRDLLSAGKPSVERTLQLMIPIARAIHYAHEQGIVHRDIKPANIMVSGDGSPYVADFGIAKRISADATISSEGRIIGTARYMSER